MLRPCTELGSTARPVSSARRSAVHAGVRLQHGLDYGPALKVLLVQLCRSEPPEQSLVIGLCRERRGPVLQLEQDSLRQGFTCVPCRVRSRGSDERIQHAREETDGVQTRGEPHEFALQFGQLASGCHACLDHRSSCARHFVGLGRGHPECAIDCVPAHADKLAALSWRLEFLVERESDPCVGVLAHPTALNATAVGCVVPVLGAGWDAERAIVYPPRVRHALSAHPLVERGQESVKKVAGDAPPEHRGREGEVLSPPPK
eukprot:1062713-Rhodomonas_salina.2